MDEAIGRILSALDEKGMRRDTLIGTDDSQTPKVKRAGYRFVLREVAHPRVVKRGATLNVRMKWSNVGVGKLYRRYPLALYLLDPTGAIAYRQVQGQVDATRWLPGDVTVTGSLGVPASLRAGSYTLGVAVVDPATEKPAIRLASDAAHVERLYRLTEVAVK